MPAHRQSDVNVIRVAWVAAALTIACAVIFLRETFLSMASQWANSASYNYCYLIPPAALFLAWVRREKLHGTAPRATVSGALALLAAATAWIAGYVTEIENIMQVAAVSIIGLSFWAVLGTEIARVMIYPLVYLFFMVPSGVFLISPLMEWTADFTVVATKLSGVPIYRDGMFLSIPEGNFDVVEACSGLRSLLVFAATGVFFAGIFFRSPVRRTIFIATSLVLPLIANGVRAYSIVMLGHISDMRWPDNHLLFGDALFGLVLLTMCLIGGRFSDLDREEAYPTPESAGVATTGLAWRSVISAGISIFIVALTPIGGAALERQFDSRPVKAFPGLPTKTEPWIFSLASNSDWTPAFSNATRTNAGHYRSGDTRMDAYIISYASKSNDAEMINSLNRLFDHHRWRQVEKRSGTVTLSGNHTLPYIALNIRSKTKQETSRVVWYWYLADDRPTVDPFFVKLRETINLFTEEKGVSSLIALSTHADDGIDDARSIFEKFLASFCGAAAAEPNQAMAPVCGRKNPDQ